MDNKNRDDITKSLERVKLSKSYSSEKAFDLLDKTAKGLSNIKNDTNEETNTDVVNNTEKDQKDDFQDETESTSSGEYESRLKTASNESNEVSDNVVQNEKTTSRLKTNANNNEKEGNIDNTDVSSNQPKISKSKLKTNISNKISNTFGFNENQGKLSKAVTVASKTGKGVSKVSGKITRASKDLDKAVSSDGTGRDYLKTSIKRKSTRTAKIVVNKTVINPIKKPVKKVVNKATAPLKKKLAEAFKLVVKKAITLLLSAISAISEFILPLALVILIIVAISSIFSWGSATTNSYQNYMTSIQETYDKEVDDFLKDNPTGIVVGVRGSYGKIDWRVPLAIMQGTGADLSLDSSEKELFNKFKDAGLLEKHEIIEQSSTSDDGEETTTKIMVITNAGYDDYMEWINNNFSYIYSFMQKKKVSEFSSSGFNSLQLELIKSLYESDNLFDEFDKKYSDYPVKYGSNEAERNLNSDNYNSKNTLTTSGYKGQCTWYSFGRALESTGKKTPTGNAQTWLSSAVAMGYTTGSRPAPNSIAVLAGRKFGHVAYVEAYDGTSITISEGNVGNACSDDSAECSQVEYANEHANELVRTKTYSSLKAYRDASKSSGLYLVGFIYLD